MLNEENLKIFFGKNISRGNFETSKRGIWEQDS